MRRHYTKELGKLPEGETYRKKAEVLEPSFTPQINSNTDTILKRARSQGYNSDDGLVSNRINSARVTRRALQSKASESVIGGQANNTDRYVALKLHKEFERCVKDLALGDRIQKNELFELFVSIGLLKAASQLTSEFLAKENMETFEQMCLTLAGSNEQETFELSHARSFFLALNHLWGDWLNPKQLLSKSNRPEKIFKTPAPIKSTSTLSIKRDQSQIVSQDLSRVDIVQDRRKSIPENADRTSEPADEELKSDRVDSDEEGLVQAPQKNVKAKEFRVDSEDRCVRLMAQFNSMIINRKNSHMADR